LAGDSRVDDANMNLDPATGNYTLHGVGTLDPSDPGINGVWEMVFNSRVKDGVLTARGIAQGTGDLAGLKANIVIEALDASQPRPECDNQPPAYVTKWYVSLLNPDGE
jgi:hypothetical protein